MTPIPSPLWAEPACLLLTKVGDDVSVNKVAEPDTEVIITDAVLFIIFVTIELFVFISLFKINMPLYLPIELRLLLRDRLKDRELRRKRKICGSEFEEPWKLYF